MKLPRDLSGDRLIAALCRSWGYAQVNRVGSHAILETNQPGHQRISVPAHATLRVGTLHSILRTVAEHKQVRREDILETL